jgi:hypothetical protein
MITKSARMTLRENREHRAAGENFHLKVSAKHVDLLNSLPEFRDMSTKRLRLMIPHRYRQFIPPVGEFFEVRDHAHAQEDRMARAVIIGMLAPESLIQEHISFRYLERSVVVESA